MSKTKRKRKRKRKDVGNGGVMDERAGEVEEQS